MNKRTALLLLALTTTACTTSAVAKESKVDPYWTQPPFGGQEADLRQAFGRSCDKFNRKPASAALHANPVFGTYGQWQKICAEGLATAPGTLQAFFDTRLGKVEKIAHSSGPEAKFTGYYKPILEGSRRQHGPYQTPLVKLPKDLTRCDGKTGRKNADGTCTTPYPSRAQIETNIGKYEPILWLKDPVDAYFLQIQGSGTVELDDGKLAHVGFAGKNGHPYVAIGKTMKNWGYLSGSITADKIRNWLSTASTASATEVYHSNPSFIFFQETKAESPGAFGVQLVPGRSLAVDRSVMPLGIPVAVETRNTHDNKAWNRTMFAHDVGSAIVGTVRGDIYFGAGPLAADRAGDQNESGRLHVLVPKENIKAPTVANQ